MPEPRPALGICLAVCLAGCSLFPASERAFQASLTRIDILLGMGQEERAGLELKALQGRAGKSHSRWLSILKRARSLDHEAEGAYMVALARAVKQAGSSQELAFLLSEAFLRSGRVDEARQALPEGWEGASSGGRDIGAAVWLAYLSSIQGGARSAPPTLWRSLAEACGEPAFLVNACLASFRVGDREGARLALEEALARGCRPDPALTLACGLPEAAVALASRVDSPSIGRSAHEGEGRQVPAPILADALYLAGCREEARRVWLERAASPQASYTDWLNAALSDPDPLGGAGLLQAARASFPAYPELGRAMVSLLVGAGREDDPRVLSSLGPSMQETEEAEAPGGSGDGAGRVSGSRADPEADWLALAAGIRGAEAAQTEGAILSLLAEYPEHAGIAEFAFYELLRIGRPEGALRALAMHRAAIGSPSALPAVRPYELLAGGKVAEAAQAFEEAAAARADTLSARNAAILLVELGDAGRAIQVLRGALAFAGSGREKSGLLLAIGDAYLRYGPGSDGNNADMARAAFRAALAEWPQSQAAKQRLAVLDADDGAAP